MRSHAGMAKQTRGRPPLVRPLVRWLVNLVTVQSALRFEISDRDQK